MLTRLFTISIFIISPLFSGFDSVEYHSRSEISKQQGIAYVSSQLGQYSRSGSDISLANLRATGAKWISLLVTQYQETITSTAIQATNATPLDADLIHAIHQAHSVGLKVMLKPQVNLSKDSTHWRGQIGQGFTDDQWKTWFTSYQLFISRYAEIAQKYSVDQFCVGTELKATQNRGDQWREVVKSVRGLYGGSITYASIWGNEAALSWWDVVDYIGVDAYYPLTNNDNPTIDELTAGWIPYMTGLKNLSSKWSKKILFTEIGYRSQDNANQHPWDYQSGGKINLQEQANTYQAVFESFFNQTWFAGMYWWSWGTDPFDGGPCDEGYSPHNKPAEDILRSWYGGEPRKGSISPRPDYSKALSIYSDELNSGWENWSRGSTIDIASTSHVYSGTKAISATIQPWESVSLHYPNLNTRPYQVLEFSVFQETPGQLQVSAHDQNDSVLRRVPVCKTIDKATIQPGSWARVRILMADMDAANRLIQRVVIKNYSNQTIRVWIDEIQLIPIFGPNDSNIFLPVIGSK